MSTVHMDAAPWRRTPKSSGSFDTISPPLHRRLDARIIMGEDQDRLIRLWREKRGEVEPEDLSDNLIVQLGTATEAFWYRPRWYGSAQTGQTITDVQKRVRHRPCTPGRRQPTGRHWLQPAGAVFEAKFMLPWTFSPNFSPKPNGCGTSNICGSLRKQPCLVCGREPC